MTSPKAINSMVNANLRVMSGDVKPVQPAEKPPDLLSQPFNDYGNAMRIVAAHGDVARYCHAFGAWLIFDGRLWARDVNDAMRRVVQNVFLEFARQAVTQQHEAASKFAGSCLNSQRITAAMREAQPHLAISPEEMDRDPHLLNFLNATVDLRTGERRPHRREDFITRIIHHKFDPYATCPIFMAFLRKVLPGLEEYIKIAIGYSLTASTSEKVIFVCYGSGNNGKTTLLAVMLELLGAYAVLLQMDTLMVKQENNNSQADLADLRGARFVMTSETEEGARLAEGKLKRITQGMGKIKAVRKYENPIEFAESHKLWLDCNHKPAVRGTDNAVWNRLHLIPFEVTIPPEDIDRDLPAKLLTEAEGILAFAVEGAVRWYRDGLPKPEKVKAAAQAWRQESDQLGRFISEACVVGEYAEAKARALYSAYRQWSESAGEHPVTETAFGLRMNERGFAKSRDARGIHYAGIGIQADVNS
jgi:putative DNA primase/helicase